MRAAINGQGHPVIIAPRVRVRSPAGRAAPVSALAGSPWLPGCLLCPRRRLPAGETLPGRTELPRPIASAP